MFTEVSGEQSDLSVSILRVPSFIRPNLLVYERPKNPAGSKEYGPGCRCTQESILLVDGMRQLMLIGTAREPPSKAEVKVRGVADLVTDTIVGLLLVWGGPERGANLSFSGEKTAG